MRQACLILSLACLCACKQSPAPTAPTPQARGTPAIRVLMLTATAGFRHDSIATAREVVNSLGFTVTATDDLSRFTTAGLSDVDVIMFALTSGELPLTAAQRAALIDAVNGGRGFIGIHSATDTLYEFPDYGRLVGAYFKEHPWTQPARVLVEDASHPATGIRDAFTLEEEFYTFRDYPRPRVQVLLRLDPASVNTMGDYPLAWAHSFGRGRAYYNALGHFPATWRDARFQNQLIAAIRWAAGK
ncbi:MAG: ThuA domain-containing protein [Vicinamibacterales bacterium]